MQCISIYRDVLRPVANFGQQQFWSAIMYILPGAMFHGSYFGGDADQVAGKSYDLIAIIRISIGKIALEFLQYFNLNTDLFANIL